MKRNGRARNGVEAKRRRARIARRLAYAAGKKMDRDLTKAYLDRVFPGAIITWGSYDGLARRFDISVMQSISRWAEPIAVTIGFEPPETGPRARETILPLGSFEVDERDRGPFLSYLHGAINRELRGPRIPASLIRSAPATPAKARAEEVIRLINEGKIRVEPPLVDPFDRGDDE
jgi:hypothetical protein